MASSSWGEQSTPWSWVPLQWHRFSIVIVYQKRRRRTVVERFFLFLLASVLELSLYRLQLLLMDDWCILGKMIVHLLNFQYPMIAGQVKLGIHAMRICQIKGGSDSNHEVDTVTLVALLNLLESRISFNNVFLRHHLFGILQILAGRWVYCFLSFVDWVV